MVIAILVFLMFLIDLLLGLGGLATTAPFSFASITTDVIFIISAAAVAYLSWTTYREQK